MRRRLVGDLGRDDVWPGTDLPRSCSRIRRVPAVVVIARAGRLLVASRLEPLGFDGASLKYRWARRRSSSRAYGGWGLGQRPRAGASPALNPLDEWRPARSADRGRRGGRRGYIARSTSAPSTAARSTRRTTTLSPSARRFRSARSWARLHVAGRRGLQHRRGRLGSADVRLTYTRPRSSVTGGARRYRPYFSLWTLWSAFSPVPLQRGERVGRVSGDRPAVAARARRSVPVREMPRSRRRLCRSSRTTDGARAAAGPPR